MAGLHRQKLVPLIASFREDVGKVGTQCFDMRLHPGASTVLRPNQSLRELGRPRFLSL